MNNAVDAALVFAFLSFFHLWGGAAFGAGVRARRWLPVAWGLLVGATPFYFGIERVRVLGARIGVEGLSAHDCRHYWATYWADKVDVLRLQEAGGWSSLAMPRRYIEESEVANEGMA